MRWGVRRYQNKDGSLTKAGLKRQAKRTEAIDKLNRNIRSNKINADDSRKRLNDLNKNGYRSETFRHFASEQYGSKKEAMDQLKAAYKHDIDYSYRQIKSDSKRVSDLTKSKIQDVTYIEQRRISSSIGKAAALVGTAGSIALGVIANKKNVVSGKEAVKVALAGTTLSAITAAGLTATINDNFESKRGYY